MIYLFRYRSRSYINKQWIL